MKVLLITINIILTLIVIWAGVQRLESFPGKKKQEFTVKKPAEKKKTQGKSPAIGKALTPRDPKRDAELVASKNIFSQDRSPNSTMGGNARVELSLVGTFTIGSCTGAIIKQKSSQRNNGFFPMGAPMMGGGRQMGIGGQMGGNRNNSGQMGIGGRMGGNRNNFGQMGGGRHPAGIPILGSRGQNAVSGSNQVVYKQYIRLGETLSNGYKLVDVQREKVTLQRGSDKLELNLEDASKNSPQTVRSQNAAAARNRGNTTTRMLQTMQNMQRMQMMQNFQMMQMINNNNNGGIMGAPGGSPMQNNGRNSGMGGSTRRSGTRSR